MQSGEMINLFNKEILTKCWTLMDKSLKTFFSHSQNVHILTYSLLNDKEQYQRHIDLLWVVYLLI